MILITVFVIILIILPGLLMIWALMAPMVMYLNTDNHFCYLEIKRLVRFEMSWTDNNPEFVLRLMSFSIPLKQRTKPPKPKMAEKKNLLKKKSLWHKAFFVFAFVLSPDP